MSDDDVFFAVVTREKKADLERKQSARCVFECRVFGQRGVGKVVAVHFHTLICYS